LTPKRSVIYSAAVRAPVALHLGAIRHPTRSPAIHIVHWIMTATQPDVYAMEPHTTNVPAEKKPMNRDNPDIHHGTLPPAAKKLFIVLPLLENNNPDPMTQRVKNIMVI
jgi:hypothetical protein